MRLFHYSTWAGEKIAKANVIEPSNRYAQWTKYTKLFEWPALTFLTTDPYWDSSVQALTLERKWEKCGSYPETYNALGIPCWRFEVNPNGLILGDPLEFNDDDHKWANMLQDAIKMGSDISKWHIAVQDAYIIETRRWENDEWNKVFQV